VILGGPATDWSYAFEIYKFGRIRCLTPPGPDKKCGYNILDNYGPYINLENSICMKKILTLNKQAE